MTNENMINPPGLQESAEGIKLAPKTGGNVQIPQAGKYTPPPKDTLYHTKVQENFHIYGAATFLFACIYAFCVYRNPSGITYLLFVLSGIFYIHFCLKKLEVKATKGTYFYFISMILLAISTFCTDSWLIIFFNKIGVLLLTISMLLRIFYNTRKWSFAKHFDAVFLTAVAGVEAIAAPFSNFAWYVKNKLDKKKSKYLYALLGLVLAIPLFVIVLLLLTSADIVFKNMTNHFFELFEFGNISLVGWLICSMFFFGYCLLVAFSKRTIEEEVKDKRKGEPWIAIPVVAVLTLIYMVFSGVQILYLFMGNMELPAGYTYAQYAREGFFQLLTVGILNLILVLVALGYFRSSKILKGILAMMSMCTFVMLISSAMRMIIYIQYYYLTMFRILVLWSVVVLFLIFAGVIIYIFKEEFPLFRYSLVVVTVLYLVLSFGHADYWIAKVNLAGSGENRSEFFKGEAYSDAHFLSKLSADAAPVIMKWEEGGYRVLYEEKLEEDMDEITIRQFNVSRFIADRLMNR